MFGKAIDIDGDIYLVDGEWAQVSGRNEVAQLTATRLRTFLGEWFLNISEGVDYFGIVFAKPIDLSAIDNELRSVISGTNGIKTINTYLSTVDRSERLLTVEFTADSIYGEVSVTETINI